MNSSTASIVSVVCTFGGAALGLALQSLLPDHHLSKETRDTVKVGSGVIATLAALVLGLLVSSAKSSFDVISSELTQSGAKILVLERILLDYGPETKSIREQLRISVRSLNRALWSDESDGTLPRVDLEKFRGVEPVSHALSALIPTTEAQRLYRSRALEITGDLQQARWLLVEQVHSVLPDPFLIILLSWLFVLYLSFGLFAPRNTTAVLVLLTCALCMSSAIYLIYELNRPLDGIIRVSSEPIRIALEHLDADAGL